MSLGLSYIDVHANSPGQVGRTTVFILPSQVKFIQNYEENIDQNL